MGTFKIQVPDGRTLTVEADNESAALTGAKQWYRENSAPPPGYGGASVDTSEVPRDRYADVYNALTGNVAPKVRQQADRYRAGAKLGLREPLDALAQMASKATGMGEADVQRSISESRLGYQPSPEGETGRLIGNLVGTAPLAMSPGLGAATLGPRLAAGAATGGVAGTLQPTEGDDFWKQKAMQAGTGAALGAGATGVLSGAARMLSPRVNPDVAALRAEGVVPTPGQTMGGIARNIEEKAKSVPLIGNMIGRGETRAIHDWNRAKVNEALAPIGATIGRDVPAGHRLIDDGLTRASAAYENILPNLSVNVDRQLAADIGRVRAEVSMLPQTQREQFQRIAMEKFTGKLGNGTVDGATAKEIDSTLGRLAAQYRKDPDADKRALGASLNGLQNAFRAAIERSNPAEAPMLQAANRSYAMMLRIQDAASRGKEGVFTPAQLLASTRALDQSARKRSFARGNALMQEQAEQARRVLGNFEPDSGTAGRLALMGTGAGAAGAYYDPETAAKVGAGLALTALPYTRAGSRAFGGLMTRRGPAADEMAGLLRHLGPSATVGLLDFTR